MSNCLRAAKHEAFSSINVFQISHKTEVLPSNNFKIVLSWPGQYITSEKITTPSLLQVTVVAGPPVEVQVRVANWPL